MAALRVVVIGAGAHIFPQHRRGLAAIEAEVVGVQDINPEGARRVADEFGCPAFGTIPELLHVPADLVVIVTPHPLHAEHTIAALRAGRHVLVEKPIAVDIADAQTMVAEAERCGRLLAVALQHRTRAEVQAARRLLQAGELGEIQRADLLATWPRRSTYYRTAPWRGTWRGEGGGVLINQGQHDLDLLCHLAGRPSRIVGWRRTRLQPIETEDTAAALVEWPGGALGSIHLSTAEVDETQRLEITGTAGRLRLLPGRLDVCRNEVDTRDYVAGPGNPYAPPAVEPLPPVTGDAPTHEAIYRNLARAIAGVEPLIAPGRDALITLELTNAITYASLTGFEVNLPLDAAAYRERLDALRRSPRALP